MYTSRLPSLAGTTCSCVTNTLSKCGSIRNVTVSPAPGTHRTQPPHPNRSCTQSTSHSRHTALSHSRHRAAPRHTKQHLRQAHTAAPQVEHWNLGLVVYHERNGPDSCRDPLAGTRAAASCPMKYCHCCTRCSGWSLLSCANCRSCRTQHCSDGAAASRCSALPTNPAGRDRADRRSSIGAVAGRRFV